MNCMGMQNALCHSAIRKKNIFTGFRIIPELFNYEMAYFLVVKNV